MREEFTFNYRVFSDAVDSFNSGIWTTDETFEWVQTAYNYVNGETEQVLALLEETGYEEESPVEVEHGLNGLQSYQLALEHLWDFLEGGAPELLDEALAAATEAHGCLKKAFEMNLDTADALQYSTVG